MKKRQKHTNIERKESNHQKKSRNKRLAEKLKTNRNTVSLEWHVYECTQFFLHFFLFLVFLLHLIPFLTTLFLFFFSCTWFFPSVPRAGVSQYFRSFKSLLGNLGAMGLDGLHLTSFASWCSVVKAPRGDARLQVNKAWERSSSQMI